MPRSRKLLPRGTLTGTGPRPRARRMANLPLLGSAGPREESRMGNVRVFQLARELNLSSQEVIDRLKRLGSDAKTASSSVDEDTADKLKRSVKIDQLTA